MIQNLILLRVRPLLTATILCAITFASESNLKKGTA